MSKKRIIYFIGILFAVIALVCFAFSIFRQGDNQMALSLGFLSNSIALVLLMLSRKRKG